jgi:hypothetical protein
MDRLYVELDSQAHSAYGELEEVEIRGHRVRPRFDSATAAAVCGGDVLEVELGPDAERREQIIHAFTLVIGGGRLRVVERD